MTSPEPIRSIVTLDEPNGPHYPFSLRDKLAAITEPSPWYSGDDNRWGRPILPFEMISVLAHKDAFSFPVRQPSVGLFLDLEVRIHEGPLYVDEPYDITHTVVAMGESRRTESFWTRSTIRVPDGGPRVASVLLHQGVFKDSYPHSPAPSRRPSGDGRHVESELRTGLPDRAGVGHARRPVGVADPARAVHRATTRHGLPHGTAGHRARPAR